MSKKSSLIKRALGRVTALLMVLWASSAAAGPVIQQSSGTLSHKGTVTITGSGFGTKTTPAPVVWDDASGSKLLDKWSGYWPDVSPTDNNNVAYRAPSPGIDLPHANITRYIAGSHGDNAGYNAGWNVILFKNRTISSYPAYTYASWYQRADDAWTFCGDNNYKVFDYSKGTSPYTFPENWYIEYNPRPTSLTSGAGWHLLDDALGQANQSLQDSNSWWWDNAVNPMSGVWSKVELEIKYTNQSDGYIKLWENGVLRVDYAGSTDKYPATSRSEGIGGYVRCSGYANNWRYYADVYLDYSRSRVVLANNVDLSKATIVETQIPSSWSNNSVTVTGNLGKLTSGQTAYLFVFDSNGQRNATGFAVTVGGTGTNTLNAPANLHFAD